MSKAVNYEEFCKHYELDQKNKNSKEQYHSYCEKLSIFNDVVSEKLTKEAIDKAKES